jgi:hypothetical protein
MQNNPSYRLTMSYHAVINSLVALRGASTPGQGVHIDAHQALVQLAQPCHNVFAVSESHEGGEVTRTRWLLLCNTGK